MAKLTQRKPPTLTWLQQAFVQAYVGAAQGNGTEACRIAGYKGPDNTLGKQAHVNLHLPKVAQEIARQKALIEAETELDLVWWRREQKRVYDMAIADGDKFNANTALRSLAQHLGAYEDRAVTGTAPTIVINMPELPGSSRLQPMLEGEIVDTAEEPAGRAS